MKPAATSDDPAQVTTPAGAGEADPVAKTGPWWHGVLREAVEANYGTGAGSTHPRGSQDVWHAEAVLAGVDSRGQPKLQQLPFSGFLDSDPRILIFHLSTNDLPITRAGTQQEVLWRMPGTRQRFVLTGKAFSVTAPILTHRYGGAPRAITLPSVVGAAAGSGQPLDPDDFWEGWRAECWRALSPVARARFSWPASGYPKEAVSKDHYAMSLDAMNLPSPSSTLSLSSLALASAAAATTPTTDAVGGDVPPPDLQESTRRWIHNSAYDNFCLLLFKIAKVDYTCAGSEGEMDRRWVYECNPKDHGAWTCAELNA